MRNSKYLKCIFSIPHSRKPGPVTYFPRSQVRPGVIQQYKDTSSQTRMDLANGTGTLAAFERKAASPTLQLCGGQKQLQEETMAESQCHLVLDMSQVTLAHHQRSTANLCPRWQSIWSRLYAWEISICKTHASSYCSVKNKMHVYKQSTKYLSVDIVQGIFFPLVHKRLNLKQA